MEKKERVFLMDEDPTFIHLTSSALKSDGFEVREFMTPDEGLEALIYETFDLAIIDAEMKQIDGIEFLQKWKEEVGVLKIPIILIGPSSSDKSTFDALLAKTEFGDNIIEVLFKPVVPNQLKAFIASYFEATQYPIPKRSRVMAVDDSKILCKMYENFFEKHNFFYEVIEDSSKAEEVINIFKPDLILMDASMPKVDGFKLTKAVKSSKELENTRVIMVTADNRKQTILEALSLGAVDILHKPFDEEVLLAKMSVHLNDKQLYDGLTSAYKNVKAMNDLLSKLSVTDGLTGLFNHRRLHEILNTEISRTRRHKHPLSVIMLDIDYFKNFNDKYGHKAGDEILKMVAVVLEGVVRHHDIPARYGGEEFAIVLPDTDIEGAQRVAEKLREQVSKTDLETNGMKANVTISLGVCQWEDGMKTNNFIEKADQALYKSKKLGRNCVTVLE